MYRMVRMRKVRVLPLVGGYAGTLSCCKYFTRSGMTLVKYLALYTET